MTKTKTLEQLGSEILLRSPASQTEVVIVHREHGLTRFANNHITQNVRKEEVHFDIRVRNDDRKASVYMESQDPETLVSAAKKAHELSLLDHNRDAGGMSFLDAPSKDTFGQQPFDGATDEDSLVNVVEEIVEPVKTNGHRSFGTSSSVCSEKLIMNSQGLRQSDSTGQNHAKVTVWDEEGTGWGEQGLPPGQELDPGSFVETAVSKAEKSRDPVELEPGPIDVILEPAAVGILVCYLGFGTFGGREFVEDRSFLSGRLGENLFGDNVTVIDDVSDDRIPGYGFDEEGMPRQKVSLIENGVARNVVHSRRTAREAGTEPTGHSVDGHGGTAAYPQHMIMTGGNSSLDDMIENAGRAVLVTQFHYCNFQDRSNLILTGMTRNGTFLVEDGKISGPIKNMRFTQPLHEAFSNTVKVGSEPVYTVSGGEVLAPSVMMEDFHFTGKTRF